MFTKKETKKKKTGQQKTRARGVVATFFNRSRTLYVKGKRVPAGLFFSPSSAGENGGALSSPLSLWRVPGRFFVSFYLSLFFSLKIRIRFDWKNTQTFFFGSRSCARESNNLVAVARARGRRCKPPRYKRASPTCARTSRTLRAPESPFVVVSDGVYVLFFFLFFLP